MKEVAFTGFAPDMDSATPGVLTSVTNMIPTTRGMKGAPSPVDAGYDAITSACRGLAVIAKLDGTRRIFSGDAAKLYEYSGGAVNDVSDTGGYTLGAEDQWTFTQFGDITIASAISETLQASTSGDFAAIAAAPKAKLCAVSSGFIMLADTDEATYNHQTDRWWCSAYLDNTDWTPDVGTQCTTGRLVDAPGKICALKPYGNGFVAYKDSAMFVANYVGSPVVWQWDRVPGDIGAAANGMVVEVGNVHFFLGNDDFYAFDGTRPVSISGPIREWFFNDADPQSLYKTEAAYDVTSGNIWWFYASNAGGGALDSAVIFNVRTSKWGHASIWIQKAGMYYTAGITYDGMTTFGTWDALPTDISYESRYWTAEAAALAVVKTDKKLYTMTGASSTSQIVTGKYGDGDVFLIARKLIPKFITPPTTAECLHEYNDTFGTSWTTLPASSLVNNRFDLLWSSRWHRFIFNFTGNVEITGASADIVANGNE